MNTPPKLRRYSEQEWFDAYDAAGADRSGYYGLALEEPQACILFAIFVTAFSNLEHEMEQVARHVLGVDDDVAAILMRSIVSVQARIDLLREVLTRARRNSKKSAGFDEILREFNSLKKIRNDYVHGRFRTNRDTGEVYIIKLGADPFLLHDRAAEPLNLKELEDACRRSHELRDRMYTSWLLDDVSPVPNG